MVTPLIVSDGGGVGGGGRSQCNGGLVWGSLSILEIPEDKDNARALEWLNICTLCTCLCYFNNLFNQLKAKIPLIKV